MKLAPIKREHIIEAGKYIDYHGINTNYLYNNYWVELPNGNEYPFKYITRIAYQLTPGNENTWLDFESNKSYRAYIKNLNFPINYYPQQLCFISVSEIEHFQSVAGKHYRKSEPEDVRKGELLFPIVRKLNYWAEQSQVENFIFQKDNHWQWSGTFKKYLWLRVYREGDSKKVYFILELENDGTLQISINCQWSNHSEGTTKPLDKEKVKQFDAYLEASGYQPKKISKEKISNYNWDKLIEETQAHIYEHAALYDELEQIITDTKPIKSQEYKLTLSYPPETTKSYVKGEKSFEGRKTDWDKKHTTSKQLGTEGENLVIKHEKEKLINLELNELADQVQKKLDGEGYDILSFDNDGNEIHLEVKTTKRGFDEPFYMSINEVEYFKEYPKNYFLYRLFNYNYATKSAEFYFKTAEELEKQEFNPTNFEVTINENK